MVIDRQLLPTTKLSFEPAKALLKVWLKEHKHRVNKDSVFSEVTFWEYGGRPFWSCYHNAWDSHLSRDVVLGFHIHENEVLLVSKEYPDGND